MEEEKYILFHGENMVVENENDTHGFAIYSSSPLGKRMQYTNNNDYVIDEFKHDDDEVKRGTTFEKLDLSDAITPVLNVGKEWVFR